MVVAGVLAGGIGSRMGHYSVPKQFLTLQDKPIVIHTIEKFMMVEEIDYIIVAVHTEWLQYMNDMMEKFLPNAQNIYVTNGGNDRNDSIKEIVKEAKRLGADDQDVILTHDSVRPFLSYKIIKDNIKAVKDYGVCDTVIPATDTIVQSDNNDIITDIPDRTTMYQGQTPQSFTIQKYEEMIKNVTPDDQKIATDVCKLFLKYKFDVKLVNGDSTNLKITHPFDYKIAKIMIGELSDD